MLGMDGGIRRTSQSPLTPAAASPMRQTPMYSARPPAIADSTVQSAVNNQLVAGYGAGQMAMKDATRRGMSRGRGQQYYSNIAQESADAQAEAGAAQTAMAAANTNANAQQQYESTMRGEQLANASLLEGLRNTQAMERLARQGHSQALYEAMRRGQFGLDQQQLDYTPLLQGLFG